MLTGAQQFTDRNRRYKELFIFFLLVGGSLEFDLDHAESEMIKDPGHGAVFGTILFAEFVFKREHELRVTAL